MDKKNKNKNKSKVKKLSILLIILTFFLGIFLFVYFTGGHYFSKIKKDNVSKVQHDKEEIDKILEKKEPELTEEEIQKNKEDEVYEFIEAHVEPIKNENDIFNILLIGTDERGDVKGARSDSMIVLSINDKSKEISITSFMRDMYVSIPKYGKAKLNSAYAYGGPELLKETLYKNFNIKIDRFVQIDFFSFVDVFDLIPDIEVEITEAERVEINKFIDEMNYLKKRPWGTNNIEKSGSIKLENGDQALSYARIRHVGNSDFDRTKRQRELLSKTFEAVKGMSIIEINDLLNKSLPLVMSDLTQGECFSMVLNIPKYKDYNQNAYRIPVDGSFSGGWAGKQQVIKVDFNKNIQFIKENIYKGIE